MAPCLTGDKPVFESITASVFPERDWKRYLARENGEGLVYWRIYVSLWTHMNTFKTESCHYANFVASGGRCLAMTVGGAAIDE